MVDATHEASEGKRSVPFASESPEGKRSALSASESPEGKRPALSASESPEGKRPALFASEFLVLRAGGRLCALPIRNVEETMRPLPFAALEAMPAFVLGCAVIRGGTVPVVDLGRLVGSPNAVAPTRYVTVRAGARRIALAVDAVCGTRSLGAAALGELPALLQGAHTDAITSLGSLDRELLVVLEGGRLLSDADWAAIEGAERAP